MTDRTVKSCFLFFALMAFFAVGSARDAQALGFGVEADYWLTSLSGDVRSDLGSVTGDTVDLRETLGLKTRNITNYSAYFEMDHSRLSIGQTPLSYSARQTLSAPFDFQGRTYQANWDVESELSLKQIDVQYTHWLLNFDTVAVTKIGLAAAVKYIDAKASLKVPSQGISEEQSLSMPIPMIGVRGEAGIGDLVRVVGNATGIGYSGSSIYDITGALEISPVPFLGVTAGYRTVVIKVDTDDIVLNATTSGFFLGVFAHF